MFVLHHTQGSQQQWYPRPGSLSSWGRLFQTAGAACSETAPSLVHATEPHLFDEVWCPCPQHVSAGRAVPARRCACPRHLMGFVHSGGRVRHRADTKAGGGSAGQIHRGPGAAHRPGELSSEQAGGALPLNNSANGVYFGSLLISGPKSIFLPLQ